MSGSFFDGIQFKMLPVEQLERDDRYQRVVEERRVAEMARDLRAVRFGALAVSERRGRYFVWDGWHRVEAARARGVTHVPCMLSRLTAKEESVEFVAQERRKALRPLARFEAKLFHGDPVACAIQASIDDAGFKLVRTAESGRQLAAVVTLEAIFRRGGVGLVRRTLDYATTWRDGDDPIEGAVLEGLARFIACYPDADSDALRARLRAYAPWMISQRAHARAAKSGGGGSRSRSHFFAEEIRGIYNERRRTGRLQLVEDAA